MNNTFALKVMKKMLVFSLIFAGAYFILSFVHPVITFIAVVGILIWAYIKITKKKTRR